MSRGLRVLFIAAWVAVSGFAWQQATEARRAVITMASGGFVPGTSVGTVFSGSGISGFSGVNHFATTNAGPDLLANNTTNAVLFDAPGSMIGTQILLGRYETATGAYFALINGVPSLVQEPGAVVASSGVALVPGSGPQAVAWAVTGGNIRWVVVGKTSASTPGAAVAVVAVSGTYAAPSTTASLVIGAGVGGVSPYTAGGIYEWKTYSRAVADYDLATISAVGRDNKFSGLVAAPSGETGITFDAKATQWSGSGSWTTSGSSPATLAVVGAPAIQTVSQRCLLLSDVGTYEQDFHVSVAYPVGPVIAPISFGRLVLNTTDPTIYFDLNDDLCMTNQVRQNGGALQIETGNDPTSCNTLAFGINASPPTNAVRRMIPVQLDGGAPIEIQDSNCNLSSGFTGTVACTRLTEVCTTPTGLVSVQVPSLNRPQVQIGVYGDSISCAAVADPRAQLGYASQVRDHYRGWTPSVGVAINCYGGRGIWDDIFEHYGNHSGSTGLCSGTADSGATPAEFTRLAQEQITMVNQVQPGGEKIVVLLIGVNDFNVGQIDTACFTSYFHNVLFSMYALDPAVLYEVVSPVSHIADAGGPSLNDFRLAEQAGCSALNTFAGKTVCFYRDGSSLLTDAQLSGVHPINSGHATLAAQVIADLHTIDPRL